MFAGPVLRVPSGFLMWRNTLLWIGLVLGLVAIVIGPWTLNRRHFQVTPDSWSYLNAAWHVTQGRGLVLSQVDPHRTVDAEHVVLRPLTQWPPVYPMIAAVPIAMGLPLDTAGVLANYLMTTLALGLALWLILRHVPPHWACVAGVLLGSAPAFTPIAGMAWSEGSALFFLMAAHLVLDDGLRRRAEDPDAFPPVDLLALCTVLGLLTRYAFLFVVPGLLIGLWWASPNDSRTRLIAYGRYLGLVALGFAPWLIRNAILTGSLEGRAQRAGTQKIQFHLEEILWQLFGRELPGMGWAAALLMLFMLALILNAAWHNLKEQNRSARVIVLPIAALISAICLAFAETHRGFDPVSFRFLAPATLLLLITGIILAAEFLERGDTPLVYQQWAWILPMPLLVLRIKGILPQHQIVYTWLLLCVCEAVAKVGPVVRERAIGWLLLVAMLGFHIKSAQSPLEIPKQARHGEIAAWMRQHLPPGTVYGGTRASRDLLLEAPEYVQLIGISSTVNRPEQWLTEESLHDLQRRFGLSVLIFPGPPSPLSSSAYGPYLARLIDDPDLPRSMGIAIETGKYRIVLLEPPPEPAESTGSQ